MGKIKRKENKQHIKIPPENKIRLDYPVFCFRYLQSNPEKDPPNKIGFYAKFVSRLKTISGFSWSEIYTKGRHGLGNEKIPVIQIRKQLPAFATPESHLTVFRATGDNRAFIGIQRGNIFHIIFIEEKFGDVYNH